MQIKQKPYAIPTAACVLILTLGISVFGIAEYADAAGDRENSTVAGWIEKAMFTVDGVRLTLDAKLDTGAKSASIHAAKFREYQRDGKAWIAFTLTNEEGGNVQVQAPLKRTARIRRAGDQVRERPVIEMTVCVAGHTALTEFTVADRSTLDYQVLIGRNFLENGLLVDSGRTFIAAGRC